MGNAVGVITPSPRVTIVDNSRPDSKNEGSKRVQLTNNTAPSLIEEEKESPHRETSSHNEKSRSSLKYSSHDEKESIKTDKYVSMQKSSQIYLR